MTRTPLIPGVEPLPDTTWKSIERKIFATLDAEGLDGPVSSTAGDTERTSDDDGGQFSRRVLVGVAFGAAVAAAALVLMLDRDPPASEVPGLVGVAAAPEGTFVETSESATRLLVDGSSITVTPRSRLWYTDSMAGTTIQLERGRVDCAVRPQQSGTRFEVRAGDVLVEVVGTRFSVDRTGDEVEVVVDEGRVAILQDGMETAIEGGQRWSSETGLLADQVNVRVDAGAPVRDIVEVENKRPDQVGRKAMFYRASELEAAEPRKAMASYAELARGDDVWAANALYAHALLCSQSGLERDAGRLITEYLSRFPEGANRDDARKLHDALVPVGNASGTAATE